MLCVRNDDYNTALVPCKLYRLMRDPEVEKRGRVRMVDEAGEDYLFPERLFVRSWCQLRRRRLLLPLPETNLSQPFC